jgi:hypothetical protein
MKPKERRHKKMKKPLPLVMLFMIILSNLCFANQYDDNPGEYIKINSGITSTIYLDKASIKSVKYAPPYYTIQCDNIGFDQADNITAKTTVIYYYDFDTKSIQLQIPKSIAYAEDGSISYKALRDAPPVDIEPTSLSFKEAIMLFKQLYGEKYAHTFLNAYKTKPESKSNVTNNANDDIPSGEMV